MRPIPARRAVPALLAAALVIVTGCSRVGTTTPTGTAPPTPTRTPTSTSAPTRTSGPTTTSTTTSATTSTITPARGTALAALATLAIKGRAPMTGYDRALFGPAWTDDNDAPDGHNGCDTRNDILRRDLLDIVLRPGSHGCTVLTGVLHDPYTGAVIDFRRGRGTSNAVQIDHVVALGDAWQKGAQRVDVTTRVRLANDPLELLAVDGPANEAKGDGDAATWLPPNKAFRCAYVARQIAVKARYGLWVTRAEHDAMARVLGRCPGQSLPTDG